MERRTVIRQLAEYVCDKDNTALARLDDGMRRIAYDLQRTGNPRCIAEAMEIHEQLDSVYYCPNCGFPTEQRSCAPFCRNCGFKGVCGSPQDS